jgi:hypothetical protein
MKLPLACHWCFLLVICCTANGFAQPTLTRIAPLAVRPGEVTNVILTGTKLDGGLRLWTSFPAAIESGEPAAGGTTAGFRIQPATDAVVSIVGLAVSNEQGGSNLLLLLIDDLPSVADDGKNHSWETAQRIELPIAIDGLSDGPQFDYYRFVAQAGQRLTVEVVAARIGSKMDPVVSLSDSAGKPLTVVDDDESFSADPRFQHTFVADGEYTLEIHDNKYAAGSVYRLRIGDFPLVSSTFPLAIGRGQPAPVQFRGPDVADTPALELSPEMLSRDPHLSLEKLPVAVRRVPDGGSGFAAVLVSDVEEILESEPNDDSPQATVISLPCGINGTLTHPTDRDVFRFTATQGTTLRLSAITRSAGSPALVQMRLLNAAGAQLAESKVDPSGEDTLTIAIPADGEYTLVVEELLQRGGEAFTYRIDARTGGHLTLQQKIEATARTQFPWAAGDGALAIDVQATRVGWDGPVTLAIAGNDRGWRLLNNVIPAGATETRVIVRGGAELPIGELRTLRLIGTASTKSGELQAFVATAGVARSKQPELPLLPPWLDGLFFAAPVPAAAEPFFEIAAESNEATLSPDTGEAQVVVNLNRKHKDFKTPLTIVASSLPAGFSLATKIEGDKHTVTLRGPKDFPAGKYPLELVGFADLAGRGRVASLPISLIVGNPPAESPPSM